MDCPLYMPQSTNIFRGITPIKKKKKAITFKKIKTT